MFDGSSGVRLYGVKAVVAPKNDDDTPKTYVTGEGKGELTDGKSYGAVKVGDLNGAGVKKYAIVAYEDGTPNVLAVTVVIVYDGGKEDLGSLRP